MTEQGSRRTAWECQYCGERGTTTEMIDHVQCPTCGEPVFPL
ncbi:MAG TPA: hypothetical protein VFK34_10755 [Marmoricola sp.]|nr:hypothetical protein [Marmoricola sp.]